LEEKDCGHEGWLKPFEKRAKKAKERTEMMEVRLLKPANGKNAGEIIIVTESVAASASEQGRVEIVGQWVNPNPYVAPAPQEIPKRGDILEKYSPGDMLNEWDLKYVLKEMGLEYVRSARVILDGEGKKRCLISKSDGKMEVWQHG